MKKSRLLELGDEQHLADHNGSRRVLKEKVRSRGLEVLTRCLQPDDDRIAMMAAQAILDRGYGRPTQSIDANINEDGGSVRYYAEMPKKCATTEE